MERSMKIGLFGFPMTGKTTMFRLLTGVEAPAYAKNGEARVAMAKVPDPRLERLTVMYSPKKRTPATIEYLDLAGVEKGQAAKALPLDQLRTADALVHVVRSFHGSVPRSKGSIDPVHDVAAMETEFILADLIVAEKRVEKLKLQLRKTNRDEDKQELDLLRRIIQALDQVTPLRNLEFNEQERFQLRGYTFLSLKPLLIAINVDESDASRLTQGAAGFGLEEFTKKPQTEVVALSAKIEAEIAQLDDEDARSFMADLGIDDPALDRMIRASYSLLGRMSFFTVGEDECRAWTVRRGTPARAAAGTIHSDIERGFIRAELVGYADLVSAGSWSACRDKGTLRLEGKNYVIQDGDVVNFRFAV
jgi:GTP-binding protein YchF